MPQAGQRSWCPRQESNLRARFRRPVLYPLSYGDLLTQNYTISVNARHHLPNAQAGDVLKRPFLFRNLCHRWRFGGAALFRTSHSAALIRRLSRQRCALLSSSSPITACFLSFYATYQHHY